MQSKEQQDIMSAQEILAELRKLADSERAENEPTSENDASHLDDAISSLEKFVAAEENEEGEGEETPEAKPEKAEGVVDTSMLTGPLGNLKGYLLKTQRDNESR